LKPVTAVLPLLLWFAAAPALAQAPARAQDRPLPVPQTSNTSTPFLGGVPFGTATSETITISILDAMRRALEHNLGVLMAEEQVGRSEGTRRQTLADLLPDVSGRVSETRQRINLAAFGFGTFPSPFGAIPSIVGPFNVFDARVFVKQSLLDFGARDSARADAHTVAAARYMSQGARDFVIHVTGTLYLEALAANARATSALTQRQTAEALYNQAVDLKSNGLIAGLDVLRAQVELNAETQRATATANDAEKMRLQLARVIGLPLGQPFQLDANLPGLPSPTIAFEDALARGFQGRPDYLAALERVKAAEAARDAVKGDRLPALAVNADAGAIGLTPRDARGTYAIVGEMNVPLFDGGRIQGRLLEAEADLRNRRAEAEDLKAQIYYDIRMAFLDLDATTALRDVALNARDLAAQQLTQSRDRFGAGVASNIEVVQAQEAVAVAEEQYIAAEYGWALAKGALLRGIGTAEDLILQLLGGAR